jgi:hypothetical protein
MFRFPFLGATLLAAGLFSMSPVNVFADTRTVAPGAADTTLSPDAAVHRGAKAPADEYFGLIKISILGVRNIIAETDARADNAADDVAQMLCRKLILAEDALRDWQAKYPDDNWVPKFGYAMLRVYEKIDSDISTDSPAGVHVVDLANWLDRAYPNSRFAPR